VTHVTRTFFGRESNRSPAPTVPANSRCCTVNNDE